MRNTQTIFEIISINARDKLGNECFESRKEKRMNTWLSLTSSLFHKTGAKTTREWGMCVEVCRGSLSRKSGMNISNNRIIVFWGKWMPRIDNEYPQPRNVKWMNASATVSSSPFWSRERELFLYYSSVMFKSLSMIDTPIIPAHSPL